MLPVKTVNIVIDEIADRFSREEIQNLMIVAVRNRISFVIIKSEA